jgi:hypothetical protein
MSKLDYAVEPKVECLDNDPNDAAFVQATATIGGRDAVEEYVECKMYPLAASTGFESVPLGMTPVSKVETPLPLFCCRKRCCRTHRSCLGGDRDRDRDTKGVGELQVERTQCPQRGEYPERQSFEPGS